MNEKVQVPLPCNIQEEDLPYFEPYTSYDTPSLEVKNIENAFVTYTGLVIDESGLVKESHHQYEEEYTNCLNEASHYYKDAYDNPDHLISLDDDNIYLLIHHPWYNYYHWICEAILRLWMVKKDIDNYILLLPDYYKNSDFIMGSLEPFNIKNIYFIPKGKSLYVKNLCMPQLKPLCDAYDIRQLHQIRNFYLSYVLTVKRININLGEKLYLSRRKAARKKVTNEKEVENLVSKYGFAVVYNEDFTFLEQISIYANARYLISIHGSGLTNMLFMQPESVIIEILKKKTNTLDRPSFVFWYQAAALGFRYYGQLANPITPNDDYFLGDFQVDIVQLEKHLQHAFDSTFS